MNSLNERAAMVVKASVYYITNKTDEVAYNIMDLMNK